MDPDKIEAIQKRIASRTVKQVSIQEFFGLTGYYRSFIRVYAKTAASILSLLKSDIKFVCSDECNIAFEKLEKCLVTNPILRQPNFGLPFILYTDASILGHGAILAQKDNKKEYVCYYASRSLKTL